MAFVSATPVASPSSWTPAAASSAAHAHALAPQRPAPACTPPSPSPSPHAPTAIFDNIFEKKREKPSGKKHDFRTAAEAAENVSDRATFGAAVVGLRSVCVRNYHWELTLDAGVVPLGARHTAAGQFVQLARGDRHRRKLAYYTLSSPPGGLRDGSVQIMFAADADPLRLRNLRAGDTVDVSVPLGKGVPHDALVGATLSDLYLFTDSVQGYAVAKSLVEWNEFRVLSGEGANRRTHVSIYYALSAGGAVPYHERLSSWACYAVNVVPLTGLSIMEHMSSGASALGRLRHSPALDRVFACVASDDTYEALFCALVLLGFRRDAIYRHTQETVLAEASRGAPAWNSTAYDDSRTREQFEDEVWQRWVAVREAMRVDFERQWASKGRSARTDAASERAKRQAWQSWFAHNSSQWDQVEWNNRQWGSYWSSWSGGGGGGNSGYSSSSTGNSSSRRAWSQQGSQEYWDWVKRGTESGQSSDSGSSSSWDDFGSGSSGAWDHYEGGSWGAGGKSGYQQRGYRYSYEDTEADKQQKRWGGAGGSTGGGAGQKKNPWGQWSYRSANERQQQRSWGNRSNSYSGGGGGGGRSQVFGDLDFYAVLGISAGASRSDIKKAYRKKAMQHHPDRNPNSQEEAHAKMKQIVVAWSVLKDDSKRERYDKYGAAGL